MYLCSGLPRQHLAVCFPKRDVQVFVHTNAAALPGRAVKEW
jgi:hypothetical protein